MGTISTPGIEKPAFACGMKWLSEGERVPRCARSSNAFTNVRKDAFIKHGGAQL